MEPEEQYFIEQLECWITRDGNGVVEDRHIRTEEDHEYYHVTGRETRYRIWNAAGPMGNPRSRYESPLKGDAFFLSSFITPTRKFVKELDDTYFKYYDDAEAVLNNIKSFTTCLKNLPKMKMKMMAYKRVVAETEHLVSQRHPIPDWEKIKTLQVGLQVRKRNDLKEFQKHLAEKDFVERD